MKVLFYLFVIIIAVILTASFFIKPFILDLAVKGLKTAFPGSDVSIKKIDIDPLKFVTLYGLKIKKSGEYDLVLSSFTIAYRLSFRHKCVNVNIFAGNGTVSLDAGSRRLYDLAGNAEPSAGKNGRVSLTEVNVSNVNFKISSADLNASGNLTAGLMPAVQMINYIKLHLDSAGFMGLTLEDADISANQLISPGDLHIRNIKYGKFRIENIKGAVRLEQKNIFIDALSAGLFGGQVKADGGFTLDKKMIYFSNLKFENINIDEFIEEGEMTEKFTMSGRLNGSLSFKGGGPSMDYLKGHFVSQEGGGTLVITDRAFLEDMAKRTGQPVEILTGSFQEYRYNIGNMQASIDKGNLMLDVALDGDAGKRDMHIVLHDFNPGKERVEK